MRRWAAVVCAFVIAAAGLLVRGSAESISSQGGSCATKIDLYCTVNTDGDCLVSMTVNLKLLGNDSGLTFPLPYSAEKITMNGSSVATSRVGTRTLVDVGRVTGGMSGEFTVRFDYTLPKAVGVTPERKLQLSLPMLSGFDYPVEIFSFIVTLPDSVETVGSAAFSDCPRLFGVTLPKTLTEITDDLFAGCVDLTRLTIPDTVETIGSSAFDGCESLSSVTLPLSLNYVKSSAFNACAETLTVSYGGTADRLLAAYVEEDGNILLINAILTFAEKEGAS